MLLGNTHKQVQTYAYGTITLYGTTFQRSSTSLGLSYCSAHRQMNTHASHNPHTATPAGYHTIWVWPHPISLATTLGITFVFSSYGY